MPIMPSGVFMLREEVSARVTTLRNVWGRVKQLAEERGIADLIAKADAELAQADELEKLL